MSERTTGMHLIEKATIMHYHRHRLTAYGGGTVQALGWKGADSQRKRFEVLATLGDFRGCTVLDVGCGYGDLKRFLARRFADFTYIGIDQMAEFIAAAKARYQGDANTFFYQTDFTTVTLPRVDYVIACGALGYRCASPGFYRDMIRKLYAAATRALAFNMLDAARFPEDKLLRGHDCDETVAFCHTLAPYVKLIKGYLEDDFTMMLYRTEKSACGINPVVNKATMPAP